jgi:cell division protein FtsI (penicillin-binding protein 3)
VGEKVTERLRRRAFALLVLTALAFTAISLRLADVQVFAARRYNRYGNGQDTRVTVLPAVRGTIFDRSGQSLALTEEMTRVLADPYQIADPAGEAAALAPVLGLPVGTVASELSRPTGYAVVAPYVSAGTASRIAAMRLAGITTTLVPERFLPDRQLARPLLGQVDAAEHGSSGLEYAYNGVLAGTPGRLTQVVDPKGRALPDGTVTDQPARPGDDLVLSLDEALQYQAEQALGQAIVASRGRSGVAIVMNTRTGGLLAVADLSLPRAGTDGPPALPVVIGPTGQLLAPGSFSPATQPIESASADAFTKVYEPGSVEKVVTVSAALATGAVSAGQTFTIPDTYPVDGTDIHDAEHHGTERLSVTGILAQSSNIGAVQIVQRLGAQNLYRYLHAFGLGSPTPVSFPGQSAGLITPLAQTSPVNVATMSYGEGMAVTATQMAAVYNTIADGGIYVAPHLVNAVIGPHGRAHPVPQPAPHRVVSTAVAQEVAGMLEQVVSAGTGRAAAVPPYATAGKTGTAQYDGSNGYVPGQTVASFVGYAPAQKPAVTVMVVVDDTTDYGAQAAAPAFATITRDALEDLDVPPDGPQPAATGSALPQLARFRTGATIRPAGGSGPSGPVHQRPKALWQHARLVNDRSEEIHAPGAGRSILAPTGRAGLISRRGRGP